MNKQAPEKRDHNPEGRLWVHSIFYTIQGEGPFVGTPCVFVRLQGCNLQCPGCDTIYTAPWGDRTMLQQTHWKPDALAFEVHARFPRNWIAKPKLVVITGGEPFRQNLLPFFAALEKIPGVYVQVETNGTLDPSFGANLDMLRFYNTRTSERRGRYIVCSPKTPKCHPDYDAVACAFKYVLDHRSVDPEDGLPINVLGLDRKKRVYRQKFLVRPIYLQPMDHSIEYVNAWPSEREQFIQIANYKSREAVKASCLQHGYIFQLQTHKLIGVE